LVVNIGFRRFLPALGLAFLVIPMGFAGSRWDGGDASHPRERTFQFSYKAEISDIPEGTRELRIWIPYPTTDAHQEIQDVQVKGPGKSAVYTEPEYHNSILFIPIENPGAGPVTVEVDFKVQRWEYLRRDYANFKPVSVHAFDPAMQKYLGPDRLVPLNDRIKKIAEEVTRGKKSDLDKARAIYDYTLANMKYDKSGEGWGHGDIIFACDSKRGNCTDFHALLIGLCRVSGIPARFSIGFPLPDKRGEGQIAGYHCWAEFYVSGYGWVPVDASEAWKHPEKKDYFFGGHDENRVQLSTGRDLVLRPRQAGEPLNYFVYPDAEADGKTLKSIKTDFRFKDVVGD
jgi:transglutaminase-like putative cysteine protease